MQGATEALAAESRRFGRAIADQTLVAAPTRALALDGGVVEWQGAWEALAGTFPNRAGRGHGACDDLRVVATQEAPDPAAVLRGRGYVKLLVAAAVLGVPIAVAAYGFLALVHFLEDEVYLHLPQRLGFGQTPAWWPVPVLLVGGVLTGLAIRYLPGRGGPSPAGGFALHGPPQPRHLPGLLLAALASLACGAVIGPEMPLVALGGGLAIVVARLFKKPQTPKVETVLAATGSFAAISTLLGSPLIGAFLLMEAAGLGGATLTLVLLPGLLASGIGFLIFTGLNDLTGLGTFSLAGPDMPAFGQPTVGQFAWAIAIGGAAPFAGAVIRRAAGWLQSRASRKPLVYLPIAGLVVAAVTIAYAQTTGKPESDVLFSGENSIGALIANSSAYSAWALGMLFLCKGIAYTVSLGAFRGGPVFPAIVVGAAGGLALSGLPGLPPLAGAAIGIAAMTVVMLSLPLTAVLLATLLMSSNGLTLMPLTIVAVVVAHVVAARIAPRADDRVSWSPH